MLDVGAGVAGIAHLLRASADERENSGKASRRSLTGINRGYFDEEVVSELRQARGQPASAGLQRRLSCQTRKAVAFGPLHVLVFEPRSILETFGRWPHARGPINLRIASARARDFPREESGMPWSTPEIVLVRREKRLPLPMFFEEAQRNCGIRSSSLVKPQIASLRGRIHRPRPRFQRRQLDAGLAPPSRGAFLCPSPTPFGRRPDPMKATCAVMTLRPSFASMSPAEPRSAPRCTLPGNISTPRRF